MRRAHAQAALPIHAHPARSRALAGEFDAYLKKMGRARTWGDELTLRAICNAFGVTLHVATSQAGSWYLKYEPGQSKTARSIFLAYISPVHYNAFALASSDVRRKRGAEGADP